MNKEDTAIMNDKVTISLFQLASKYPTKASMMRCNHEMS